MHEEFKPTYLAGSRYLFNILVSVNTSQLDMWQIFILFKLYVNKLLQNNCSNMINFCASIIQILIMLVDDSKLIKL